MACICEKKMEIRYVRLQWIFAAGVLLGSVKGYIMTLQEAESLTVWECKIKCVS